MQERPAEHVRQAGEPGGGEVGVVALGLAGERGVQAVVDVVAPLGVQPVAAGLARGDQPRVVEVGLGDQRQRPAQVRRQRLHLDRQLLQQVRGAVVVQRVHGVEPQPVDVEVAQPHQRVVDRRTGAPASECGPSRLSDGPQMLLPAKYGPNRSR